MGEIMKNTATMIDNIQKTKKELVKEIYMKNHDQSRNAIVNKVVEELLMPIESARTHVSWVAKELNPILNKPFKTRKRDPLSLKKVKAYEIFENNTTLSRKEMIAKFQTELGMSENSAATHCSMCVKEFKIKFVNIQHNSIT